MYGKLCYGCEFSLPIIRIELKDGEILFTAQGFCENPPTGVIQFSIYDPQGNLVGVGKQDVTESFKEARAHIGEVVTAYQRLVIETMVCRD